MTHYTHNALRLGDNLAHCHFLRKLALVYTDHEFVHFAHLNYVRELAEVVCDIRNIKIAPLELVHDHTGDAWTMKPWPKYKSIDSWKNADKAWEESLWKNDYGKFMLAHFRALAGKMGLISPLIEPSDLLFDYPILTKWNFPRFDVLFVNSQPMSGQMPGYAHGAMENLVLELSRKNALIVTQPSKHPVTCTTDKCLSVSQIGALSRFCRYIVQVATGPSWPTINIHTAISCEFRLILNGDERLTYVTNCDHAATANEARALLQIRGIL